MGKARHLTLLEQELITSLGVLDLDHQGFVVNQEALSLTDDQLLALPGFIDNDDFPVDKFPVAPIPPQVEVEQEEVVPEPAVTLVSELLKEEKNLNSQGNLDLQVLNTALEQAGLEKVNGAGRDSLVAKAKSL